MKILHTSDWHLGQKLLYNDRHEEHQRALRWLHDCIVAAQIDVLLVAGDIFDMPNPPHEARKLYYRFLAGLVGTCCQHIIITGGNHDSAAMLNAPQELLAMLNIYVVGAATEDPAQQIITLRDANGSPSLVVAAVPFLRESDLKKSVTNETATERYAAIQAGIAAHFTQVADLIAAQLPAQKTFPVVAMAHLFATNATDNKERQSSIYVGNIENINAAAFPPIFDYVALGHIHRAQTLQPAHIRYSGSLIPLSFAEATNTQTVTVATFAEDTGALCSLLPIEVPLARKLVKISGSLDEVLLQIANTDLAEGALPTWAAVTVFADSAIPLLDALLREAAAKVRLEVLYYKVVTAATALLPTQTLHSSLDSLTEMDVFLRKCASDGLSDEDTAAAQATFLELFA